MMNGYRQPTGAHMQAKSREKANTQANKEIYYEHKNRPILQPHNQAGKRTYRIASDRTYNT